MSDQICLAEDLLNEERLTMLSSADLLHRRLGRLIEHGREGVGHDLPTIVSLLARMRDSVESYRSAQAVVRALRESAILEEPEAPRWESRK